MLVHSTSQCLTSFTNIQKSTECTFYAVNDIFSRKDGSKNLGIEKDPEPSLLLLSRSKTELPPTEESASLCLTCETKRWESLTVEVTSETEDEVPPELLTEPTSPW